MFSKAGGLHGSYCTWSCALLVFTASAAAQTPSLTVEAQEGCLVFGGKSVRIGLDSGTESVIAAQFSIKYDPGSLDFVNIRPGNLCDAESPFTLEGFRNVNESEGEVFYVVVVDPLKWGSGGLGGQATLACVNFATAGGTSSDVCLFNGEYPQSTILVNGIGNPLAVPQSAQLPAPLIACDSVVGDDQCVCVPERTIAARWTRIAERAYATP